MLVTNIF